MDLTPVVIGVGEASERIDAKGYEALSPAELARRAALEALSDALDPASLAPHIDVIATVRQFETSGPRVEALFGRADNFPRALARRIGADPARAVLEPVGGQGPQHLINEFANSIGAGNARMVLLAGAEAISTQRHLMASGQTRDWSETVGGQLEDRGFGETLAGSELPRHGARTPISLYALFENARRGRLGLGRAEYAMEMGRLFAPFTEVAAGNPHAMSREILSASDLATVTPSNRLTSDPFPRRVVARDQTNQGAAVLLTSAGHASALGVPRSKFVYLLGGADARERAPLEREDLSASPAAVMSVQTALGMAGATLSEIDLFDLYSCFPIAVFNVRDGLGIAADDPRPLTVTGGLPYFGGAGNNYSMHAVASMVRALRSRPKALGLVGANGGFLSKYSVGVYSATPRTWRGIDSASLQAQIDAWSVPPMAHGNLSGTVATYTIDYSGKEPIGIVIGHREGGGGRFVARTDPDDPLIALRMAAEEPLGARVTTQANAEGRSIITTFETPESHMKSAICDMLGIEFPLMAFSHCRDVVAAVSRAGGFGVLGATAHTPETVRQELKWIGEHSGGKPFGIDVLIPENMSTAGEKDVTYNSLKARLPVRHVDFARGLLNRAGVAAHETQATEDRRQPFDPDQALEVLEAAFEFPIGLIANALGVPPPSMIEMGKRHGVPVAALVGAKEHALRQVAAGVDILVAQGTEAGGHCGEVSTLVLIPEVIEAVRAVANAPVVAAGGIMNGRQMAACMAMGAAGVWTGSVWLATTESETTEIFREKMIEASSRDAVRTRSRTGKPARQLRSAWTEAWDRDPASPGPLPMPMMSLVSETALRQVDRAAAAGNERARELVTYFVGQGVGLIHEVRAAGQVVQDFKREFIEAVDDMQALLV